MKKIINILGILFILGGLLFPFIPINVKPVHASTYTANITGAGSQATGLYMLNFVPGGTFANLQTDDSDASTLYFEYGAWYYNCYPITAFSSSYYTIDSVTIYYKSKYASTLHGYSEKPYIRISGNNYYGDLAALSSTFQTFSYSWSTNPATGLAWTDTAINAAEYGLAGIYSSTTYFYVVVTYTAPAVPSITTNTTTNIIYSGAAHYALLNGTLNSWSGNTTDTYKGFVYGTSSVAANPGNVGPLAGYTTVSANTTGTGTGAYSANITGMAAGTTYYYRAYAHNSIGFSYGDELTFTTLTNPTITNLAATTVSSSTAQVNSQVTFDGNTSCNITFGLALSTQAVFTNYTSFYNVSGTYVTGQYPLYALTSLNASATYYYNVRIQNSYGTAYGTELTFTTTSGVNEPYGIIAIPSSNSISVSWIKNGSQSTMVRWSTGTYPTGTAVGNLAYIGTGSSCLITGLNEGVNHYISLWGLTGGVYSTNYSYVMATTTAFTTASQPTISAPANPGTWGQTPSSAGFQIPFINQLVQANSTAYDMPVLTIWYICWFIAAVVIGIFVYNKGNNNLTAGVIALVGYLVLGTVGGLFGFEVIVIILGIIGAIVALVGRY